MFPWTNLVSCIYINVDYHDCSGWMLHNCHTALAWLVIWHSLIWFEHSHNVPSFECVKYLTFAHVMCIHVLLTLFDCHGLGQLSLYNIVYTFIAPGIIMITVNIFMYIYTYIFLFLLCAWSALHDVVYIYIYTALVFFLFHWVTYSSHLLFQIIITQETN